MFSYQSNCQIHFTEIDAGDLSYIPGGYTFDGQRVGGTWIDFDQDGDIDFFDGYIYYQNDGVNHFVADSFIHSGNPPTIVDLNNDRRLDLISTNDTLPTTLHINFGNTYEKIILDDSYGYNEASCVDFNNDGLLDILLTDIDNNNRLYVNKGTTFLPETNQITGSHFSTWADFDNDGDMDLMCSALYENLGDGTFERKDDIQGTSWGDYNNDGFEDLFGVLNNHLVIYTNNQGIGFTIDTIAIADDPFLIGSSWGDLDNDGDLDLLISDWNFGHSLFLNNNGILTHINFEETYKQSKLSLTEQQLFNPALPMSLTFGDINHDGNLDAFIGYDSGTPNQILLNVGNTNSWLGLNLEGTESNANGIGARVTVEAVIDGKVRKQYRQQRSRHGPNAGNLTMHFGLGNATTVDKLTVEWPSGNVTELQNVDVGQYLVINEDMVTSVISEEPTSMIYPNPANEYITIRSSTDYYGTVLIEIFNMNGKEINSSQIHKGDGLLEHKMGIQNLATGTYFLKVRLGDQVFIQKIIKE
ncbi:Por secretion system C-terminal sorting domain-containing protein [Ekhidna lutea]|uniref:Por secretion system C-terminal sorting domain-containing protein n=2 Tax=Ekhidna lutea TaxID=447679 RepID=A0A239FP58_EKHLU|nr:Por secretion system C-terminal sorting domain-containing protein [Ekhidna lutea]